MTTSRPFNLVSAAENLGTWLYGASTWARLSHDSTPSRGGIAPNRSGRFLKRKRLGRAGAEQRGQCSAGAERAAAQHAPVEAQLPAVLVNAPVSERMMVIRHRLALWSSPVEFLPPNGPPITNEVGQSSENVRLSPTPLRLYSICRGPLPEIRRTGQISQIAGWASEIGASYLWCSNRLAERLPIEGPPCPYSTGRTQH